MMALWAAIWVHARTAGLVPFAALVALAFAAGFAEANTGIDAGTYRLASFSLTSAAGCLVAAFVLARARGRRTLPDVFAVVLTTVLGVLFALRAGTVVGVIGGDGAAWTLAFVLYPSLIVAAVVCLAAAHAVEAWREAHELATLDPLTELMNRRGLERAAAHLLHRARRTGEPLTLVVVDVNDFKGLNDRHGYAAGDAALRDLARRLRAEAGPRDVVARLGGDEFVLVWPGLDAEAARLRAAGLETVATRAAPEVSGVSVGLAVLAPGDDLAALIARADSGVRRAKGARGGVVPGAIPPFAL
jgi:diguanylate cyclase (GGDEF)-like protein